MKYLSSTLAVGLLIFSEYALSDIKATASSESINADSMVISFTKVINHLYLRSEGFENLKNTEITDYDLGLHTLELLEKTRNNFITFFNSSTPSTITKLSKVGNTLVANAGTLKQLKASINSPRIAKYAFANFDKLPKEFVFNGKLGSLSSIEGMPEGVGVICELSPTLYAQPIGKTHNALWCILNIADNKNPMYVLYQADVAKYETLAGTTLHVYRNGALFNKLNSFLRYQNMNERKRMDIINTLGDPTHFVRQARLSAAYDNVSVKVNGKNYPVKKTTSSNNIEVGAVNGDEVVVSNATNKSNSGVAGNDNYSVKIRAKEGSGPISLDFGD